MSTFQLFLRDTMIISNTINCRKQLAKRSLDKTGDGVGILHGKILNGNILLSFSCKRNLIITTLIQNMLVLSPRTSSARAIH